MRLSTSSSKLWATLLRWDAPTILIPILLLGLAEIGIRWREAAVSSEVAHLRSIPAAVKHTLTAPTSRRVVIVGNSLTRCGIDKSLLAEQLVASGADADVCVIHPSETTVRDWYYLLKNYVFADDVAPDTVILCGAPQHLADGGDIRFDIFSRFLARPADWPELVSNDLRTFRRASELVITRFSAVWANREAVHRRVMGQVVPGYGQLAHRVNAYQRSQMSKPKSLHYTYLDRILGMTTERGAETLLVAMPLAEPYEVAEPIHALARKHGARLIDFSGGASLSPSDFSDGAHLRRAAAPEFTRRFAAQLGPLLQRPRHARAEQR